MMKINLILLASGFSKRFNGNKLLADLKGKPLYMHIIDKVKHLAAEDDLKIDNGQELFESQDRLKADNRFGLQDNQKLENKFKLKENFKFNKIICVTQYKEIEKSLKNTPIHVIINKNSHLGISSSIKEGINYDKNADGYMFMVCDQPFVRIDTLKRIVEAFSIGDKGICAAGKIDNRKEDSINEKEKIMDNKIGVKKSVCSNGIERHEINQINEIIGNPVLFSRKYIDELLSLEGDTGGKKILKLHMDDAKVVYLEDELELVDIDTRDSYEYLQKNVT